MLIKMNVSNYGSPEAEFENLNESLALKIKGGLNNSASLGVNASKCNESGCNNSGCGKQTTQVPVLV